MGLQWSFIRNKYLYPSVPPFWEKIAYLRISWKKFTLLNQRRTWTQIHIITKKHTLKGTTVPFIRHKYLYPSVPPFWKIIAYVSIFYKISSCEKKKSWFVTTDYTQGDYSGLSYDINIYTSAFRHFEKKIASVHPVEQQNERDLTQIHVITKKARHTLKGTTVVFHTT